MRAGPLRIAQPEAREAQSHFGVEVAGAQPVSAIEVLDRCAVGVGTVRAPAPLKGGIGAGRAGGLGSDRGRNQQQRCQRQANDLAAGMYVPMHGER